jgi:hypothetical protein
MGTNIFNVIEERESRKSNRGRGMENTSSSYPYSLCA